ncbi:MAG TPA: ribonuclease HII [Ignavibacteriaceae bacterium]|nr:ribonuclease HII [Ignavibacteriaceae bacterium]
MKEFDLKYLSDDIRFIAGCDEAGRGPLAGPVVAAAVIFPNDFYYEEIDDSKKLTEKQREKLFPIILQNAVACSVASVSHGLIDKINILNASLLAMKTAVKRLRLSPDLILVDGNKAFDFHVPVIPVIKGDSKSFSIAAASVIAKVVRDRIMKRLDVYYPVYNWKKNKGYPTKKHLEAVNIYGLTPLHRKTFLKKFYERQSLVRYFYDEWD